MKIIIIYDNSIPKNEVIADIIGNKGFGDVVVRKQHIEDYIYNKMETLFNNVIWEKINYSIEYASLLEYIQNYYDDDIRILHYFSNYYISDFEKALLSFEKLLYIDEPYKYLFDKKVAGLMFPNAKTYLQYCNNIMAGQNIQDATDYIKNSFETEGLIDLSQIDNFIHCLTSNADTRYFNQLKDNEFTMTKTSVDKLKIKKEYTFYKLIPDEMKSWFVMPYNYKETDETASYTMERFYMTDLAIKYVHGSIDETKFNNILNKYFYFFKIRSSRTCSKEKYKQNANDLYDKKLKQRIGELKAHNEFIRINKFLSAGNIDLDEILTKYFTLKDKIESKINEPSIEVIGHGDPGFANTLYNQATQMMKFIDPKGALTEEELWTDPYYDVAKLSHCVCGKYDFFNNGMFDIRINEKFEYILEIPFDNNQFKEMFKQKAIENGFNYDKIRLYEASLFLSMLPLHIDNPFKVLGFILNAKDILEEIENNV